MADQLTDEQYKEIRVNIRKLEFKILVLIDSDKFYKNIFF